MGGKDGGRTPEQRAFEHGRMQREGLENEGKTEGGLRPQDLANAKFLEQLAGPPSDETDPRAAAVRSAPPAAPPEAPAHSILDSIEPPGTRERIAEQFGGAESGRSLGRGDLLRDRALLLRLAGMGLALAGMFMLWQALQDRGLVTTPVPATAAPATLAPAATTAAPSTPIPTAARPATPLSAGPVVATQSGTTTSYTVEDLKGDGLRYDWRHSATCASHSGEATATYSWDHPHPPCPDEPFHSSFITVQITDASGQALVRQYTLGSRAGRGEVPAGGGVFSSQTPRPTPVALSPTPFPTTTTRPATGTPAPTASPTTATGGGANVPLALLGGVLVLGGLGVAWKGPFVWGGPRIRKDEPIDPCEKEQAAEAAARARLDAARSRRDRISGLSDAQRRAAQDAEAKARAAQQARVGASSGSTKDAQGNEVIVYTNKAKGAQIAAADAASSAAQQAAEQARSAFNAAGGAGELTAAQDELYKANRDRERANEALAACLRINAPPPPPPPPPPPTGGRTTTGGGTALGGPVLATGGSTQTRERRCTQGEVREGSARTTTREITVNELNRAEIVLDAIYPGAQHTPISEFIEWMDIIRRSLKAGKAINSVINGTIVEGTLDTIDATEIHDVPDFLTYWDKLTEATLHGLKQTSDIFIDRFGKLGGYSLKYTRRIHTATCRTWEECDGGGNWVRKSEVHLEITRTERNRTTRTIDVHDKREIPDAIDRLFTDLAGENDRGTRALKAFEEACGR